MAYVWSVLMRPSRFSGCELDELRAQKLGKCSSHGPRAYTQLYIRGPERPNGPIGPWRLWSEAKSLCSSGF
jgi:hypothetical protein